VVKREKFINGRVLGTGMAFGKNYKPGANIAAGLVAGGLFLGAIAYGLHRHNEAAALQERNQRIEYVIDRSRDRSIDDLFTVSAPIAASASKEISMVTQSTCHGPCNLGRETVYDYTDGYRKVGFNEYELSDEPAERERELTAIKEKTGTPLEGTPYFIFKIRQPDGSDKIIYAGHSLKGLEKFVKY